jgi:hypothetical protein
MRFGGHLLMNLGRPPPKRYSQDQSILPIHDVLTGLVLSFALWTLVCHISVFTNLSFRTAAPFFFPCLALASTITFLHARNRLHDEQRPNNLVLILVLGGAGAAVTLIAHRPNIDDSFYLSIAAHAVSHPQESLLSHDTLYGEPDLPLLLAVYKVQSYELLSAAIAWSFSLDPATAYYLIVPVAFAIALPFGWSAILQALAPNALRPGFVMLFLLMILAGEGNWSAGNFAYVRMFQGKAVLVSLFVPLVYAQAWRYSQTRASWDWMVLAAVVVGAIGCSSTALFIVPCALALALAACWIPGCSIQRLSGLSLALYPVALALALRQQTVSALNQWLVAPADVTSLLVEFFGPHQIYVLLPLAWLSWLSVKSPDRRRRLVVLAVLYVAGPANPALSSLIAEHITSAPLYWRILWIVPWPVFSALGIVGILTWTRQSWPHASAPTLFAWSCLLFLATLALPNSVIRSGNGVRLGVPDWKVDWDGYTSALELVSLASGSSAVAAPEEISAWIPTMVNRPPVIMVREMYSAMLEPFRSDVNERVVLQQAISGRHPADELVRHAVDRLKRERHLDVIATTSAVRNSMGPLLNELGFTKELKIGDYSVFVDEY